MVLSLLLSLYPSGWRLRSSVAAVDSRAGIDGRLSSPPSGGADGSVSCTLDALCIDRFSGQSWPILDFPLCELSAGLCRFSLAQPSWCLSVFTLALHQLNSPHCGLV